MIASPAKAGVLNGKGVKGNGVRQEPQGGVRIEEDDGEEEDGEKEIVRSSGRRGRPAGLCISLLARANQ
jgi:hypothetical protein